MSSKFLEINSFIDELYIKNCELRTIARGAFQTYSLEGLKILKLSGNDIQDLNTKFVGLGSLEDLTLANMPLKEFRTQLFASFSNLRSLTFKSITNNDFIIRGSSYQPLAIYELYFNENHMIDSIQENSFDGCTNVQIIDLSRNSIKFIEKNAFNEAKFPNLLCLDLLHNKLTILDPTFFSGLPEKTKVILNFNPWRCDCNLKNVIQYLALQKSKGIVSLASCEYPNEYKGMKLMDLDWEDLCGGYHRLQCNVGSKPPETVHVREQRLGIVNADNFETMKELKLWSKGNQQNTKFMLIAHMNALDVNQCYTFSENTIHETYLKFDQTYRICRLENDVKTISILDCVIFYRGPNTTPNISTVWIYMSERSNIMIYSFICNCVAFLFGIPVAYLMAILFPVVTRNRNDNLYVENERIQEVKDRL